MTNPVDEAITSRRSIRAFLDRPVPTETVRHLLAVAARAPSGTNMQPWKVYVTTGAAKEKLSETILAAHEDPDFDGKRPYAYYPQEFPEPYKARRKAVGLGLYSLLGIGKGEREKMHAQHGRNFTFFDAPVGMIFTLDERLEMGSWLDYGMFMQNIMTVARGHGLDTCPQAAFANFQDVIRPALDIPESEIVICGMALGYADPDAVENTLETERADVDEFTVFLN